MALWIDIRVNGRPIGVVEWQRIDPLGQPAEYEVCSYKMKYYDRTGHLVFDSMFNHEYLIDNPLPMITAGIEVITKALTPPSP